MNGFHVLSAGRDGLVIGEVDQATGLLSSLVVAHAHPKPVRVRVTGTAGLAVDTAVEGHFAQYDVRFGAIPLAGVTASLGAA